MSQAATGVFSCIWKHSSQVLSSSCTHRVPSALSLKLQCGLLPQDLKLCCRIIWTGQTDCFHAQRAPVKVQPQILNVSLATAESIQRAQTQLEQSKATSTKMAGRKQHMIFQKWFSDKYIYFSFRGKRGKGSCMSFTNSAGIIHTANQTT